MKTLCIGELVIPDLAALDLDQQYEPIGGQAMFRAADGTGESQSTWSKTRITTSGSGWLPAGLEALDFRSTHVLRCIVPESRVLPADVLTVSLPAARRSDAGHLPYALALLPGGLALPTALDVAGDVANITAVSGATAYSVGYYPQYTVWVFRPTRSGSRSEAVHRWQLVCEEA